MLPNFFCSAQAAPGLIEELWGYAESAYLDLPLPSVFKERLFVHLSRFCEVRYCIVRHAGFLVGKGWPAGDHNAPPETIDQVVALLRRPIPDTAGLADAFERMKALKDATLPVSGTQPENDLFDALTVMFVDPASSVTARASVRSAYGDKTFEILTAYLAFIRTAHYWTETHPELSCEFDMVELMKEHPILAGLLLDPSDAERAKSRRYVQQAASELQKLEGALRATQDALKTSESQQATERKRAEEAIAYAAAIVQSSDDAIISKSLDGVIKSWNDGAERLFGYSAEEAIGQLITMLIPPDRLDEEPTIIERLKRGERVDHFETKRRHKDGTLFDISLTISPVKDALGRIIGASKVARDISERKQTEETQRLLLAELNHRVKNTLATVQSIVQMTMRHTKDPAKFAKAFAGRVQSLSRVHGVLTDATWQGADLRALISDQLLSGVMEAQQLETEGPDVRLPPQMALHLALMLHELGTNAAKYGALSVPNGAVTIRWAVADKVLKLHWSERGGPRVKAPTRRGFGSTLIENTAKGVGGQAQAVFDAGGVSWRIELPLPEDMATARVTQALQPKSPVAPPRIAPDAPEGPLAGLRLLVVEDEPLVAMDCEFTLVEAGAVIAGVVGSIKDALEFIEKSDFDGALLDANLHGRPVDDIAAALTRRGVPFIFVSGYGQEGLPQAFSRAPALSKPYAPDDLIAAVEQLRRRSDGVAELKKKPLR